MSLSVAQGMAALLSSLLVAALGTLAVRAVARRHGLVIAPRADRWHEVPTALYGGVAIAIAAVVTAVAFSGVALAAVPPAVAILTTAALLFGVGLVDDARGIGPVGKFILQLGCGSILIVPGIVYPLTPWDPVNIVVTLFWFVGIVNALNLLDNMDGVAAGVAAVAALSFAAFFAMAGSGTLAVVALATAGAAGGFLIFNFKPASIFMGDAGSLFLGATLAGLGAAYPLAGGSHGPSSLLVPALILLVPILDTVLVTVTRTLHNRRISVGGKDHSTHRLVAMGFSESGAALFLYGLGVAATGIAWAVRSIAPAAGLWLGLVFLTGALVFTGYLGRLHKYDDGMPAEERRRGMIFRNILVKRRGLVLLLDVVLFGVAYYGAFLIYYEGRLPAEISPIAHGSLSIVIVLKLAAFHYFRVYKGVWDRAGLADVHRIVKATLMSGLLVISALFLFARGGMIPRTVFVLDLLLTGTLAMAARNSFRSLDRLRQRLRSENGIPVLLYGAGPEADVVLDALRLRREGSQFQPVGFLDDHEDRGTLIHGVPVLGSTRDLATILARTQCRNLILAAPLPAAPVGRELLRLCDEAGIEVLTVDLSFRSVNHTALHPLDLDESPPLTEREISLIRA